jgi:hypothetical protein
MVRIKNVHGKWNWLLWCINRKWYIVLAGVWEVAGPTQ